jgi:hypothetical protein
MIFTRFSLTDLLEGDKIKIGMAIHRSIGVFLFLLLLSFSQDGWREKVKGLREALAKGNSELAAYWVGEIAKDDSPRAARFLLGLFFSKKILAEEVYWQIIYKLGSLKDEEAFRHIERSILSRKGSLPLRRDLFISIALNHSEAAESSLIKLLERAEPQLKLDVMEELAKRRKKKFVNPLIELLTSAKRKDLKEKAVEVLQIITGQALLVADEWRRWWQKNEGSFVPEDRGLREPGKTGVLEIVKGTRNRAVNEIKDKKLNIIVVKGKFDKIENVLEGIKIPYKLITKEDLQRLNLKDCDVLLINCDDMQDEKDRLRQRELKKIREFLKRGGYLFTSDWGLKYILEELFSGKAKAIKSPGNTEKIRMEVNIYPKKGFGAHPLLKDVFIRFKDPKASRIEHEIDFTWRIHEESFLIKFDPHRVTVLAESPELGKRYGYPAVVITFLVDEKGRIYKAGMYKDISKLRGGRVLHVIGHFDEQRSKWDEYLLQNMLLNFLIEKNLRVKLEQR